MPADQLLREGRLNEALDELKKQVRGEPANTAHRVFLFQLLAVQGQWDRALTQLEVCGNMDPGTLAMVQTYREALRCEVLRAAVFRGERSPMLFGEPEPWVAWMLEALRLTATERYAESQSLRDRAFEEAPASSGTADGQRFEWIADADPRLGPVLEAVINGRYYWIPIHRIKSLRLEKPHDLRDVVWMPAYFTWTNGGETVGLIPTRYPGSESAADSRLQLARLTSWEEKEGGVYIGMGQRVLSTDVGEFPLMDLREILLDNDGQAGGTAAEAQADA